MTAVTLNCGHRCGIGALPSTVEASVGYSKATRGAAAAPLTFIHAN